MTTEITPVPPQAEKQLVKMALDMGPLVLFFLANYVGKNYFGLDEIERVIAATSVFVFATFFSLVIGYVLTKKISNIALFSAVLVLFFGGLTVFFQDKMFIQLKFTLINAFFGFVILGGLVIKKPLLAMVLNKSLQLTEEGWYKISMQWGFFFLAMAAINEVLRRMVSWDTWTNIKFFALMPLMFVFIIIQAAFMMRYIVVEPATNDEEN